MAPASSNYYVRSVDRALVVLSCFVSDRPRLNISELTELSALDKTTVYRLLCTLEARQFIWRDPVTQYYELGPKMIELGSIASRRSNLTTAVRPYLERLRDESQESAGLFYWSGAARMCVDQVESPQAIRQVSRVGESLPLLPGAVGKAALSTVTRSRIEEIVAELHERFGTPIDLDTLHAEIDVVRTQGFSVNEQKVVAGGTGVAAPIARPGQEAVAVVGIYGPTTRVTRERAHEMGSVVRDMAREISSAVLA